MFRILAAIAVALLLTACGTKEKIVYVDNFVFVEPPRQTLPVYAPTPMIEPSAFRAMRDDQKVAELLMIVEDLATVNHNYTVNLTNLGKWVIEQRKIYAPKEKLSSTPEVPEVPLTKEVIEDVRPDKPDK